MLVAGGAILPDVTVISHAVTVPSDVDDVTVVEQAVDEGAGHDVVTEDRAPVFKALVAGKDRRGVFVPPAHELEKEHGPIATDGEIANLIHDQQ